MTAFNPFFINSNICLKQEDICDFDTFMKTIAGNTGNSYITYSLMKELGVDASKTKHIPSIYTYDFNNLSKDAEIIRENCSHLFLILQEQIRISESYGLQLPYKGIEQLIEKSQKPLVIMGLGANSFTGFDPEFYRQLKPELVDFLKFLSDHTPEIGVRGNFTAEVLNQLGIKNVRVIGCPSFYEMGPSRVVNKAKDIEIKDVCKTGFCPIPTLLKNHHICQDYHEENIIKAIAFNEYAGLKNTSEIDKILQHKYHVFSSMQDWKNYLSHFKFLVGTRLHGSICAINSGVPAMCCNGDSRAREMCEFLHIPYYPHVDENTDVLRLYEQADIDDLNKNYPMLFDNFKDFIVKNVGITPFKEKAQISQPSLRLYADFKRNKSEMIKEKLQIMLITYNRVQKLKNTLDCLLDSKSPIKDFDITVLDNASTDGTSDLLDEYAQKYPNLKHIRHERNIGGNANICRAFELGASSGKDYVWVLCDDDKYDFSNWGEVEKAISEDADIVCLSDYIFPTNEDKKDTAYQIFQLTFVPAGIYKTSLITDTVLMNMYDSIYTMFQQSCLTISVVNNNGTIHVCSKPLVFNGWHFDKDVDVSYARGSKLEDCLARRRDQVWVVGYVNVLSLLKNHELQKRCLEVSIPYKDIYGSWDNFYNRFSDMFLNQEKFNYFYEVWNAFSEERKQMFIARYSKRIQDILVERGLIVSSASKVCLKNLLKSKMTGKYLLQSIFSIKNSHDKKYKIVKILGVRIKIKRRKKNSAG